MKILNKIQLEKELEKNLELIRFVMVFWGIYIIMLLACSFPTRLSMFYPMNLIVVIVYGIWVILLDNKINYLKTRLCPKK